MRSANEKKMFDLLLDEIEDTLHDIEQRCLKLESSDQNKELQIIFRAAHNVKGASQLYGLNDFGAFVHAFEDLLTTLQKTASPVTAASVDLLLAAQSFLRNWIQGLREQDSFSPDQSVMRAALKKHIEELKAGAGSIPAAAPAATSTPAASATATSTSPTAGTPSAVATTTSTAAAETHSKPAAGFPPADIQQQLAAAVADALTSPAASSSPSGKRNRRSAANLRISSQKIDEIMQLIGELSIHQGILWHNYQQNTFNLLTCKNAVTLIQKNLKDLYDLVLTLRMQPAEGLFQRIERTARDLAREQQKKVNIQLIGAETPLDKTVIELITDPMIHLVRNAIDHGIEDDETRLKLGKPVPARLAIQTHHESGYVVISISDDGRGLDPQMILEKAVKKGLVLPGAKMKDEDIRNLIFLPGFSTRDQVTHISGRGVGMDIVQKAIEQLGGRIETSSKKGQGTTFQITLPASLEIIEGLMVRVSDQLMIVPRQDVIEIVDLNSYEVDTVGQGSRAINVRGMVVPIEDLSDYVGFDSRTSRTQVTASSHADLSPANSKSDNAHDIALMIRLSDRTRLALKVDAVVSQQQIVVRPLADHLADVPGFTGVTILGNGEPAMILSTTEIGEKYLRWIHRDSPGKTERYGETA